LTGWMLIDSIRSDTISLFSASVSILCLICVEAVLSYGMVQGSFDFEDTHYEISLFFCTYARIATAFIMSIVITYALLVDHNLATWNSDTETYGYRTYMSESSNAMRVSLMEYDDHVSTRNVYHRDFDHLDRVVSKNVPETPVDKFNESMKAKHKAEFQSYYSLLFVSWITPLFILAKARPLVIGDMPQLPQVRASALNSHAFAVLLQRDGMSLFGVLKKLYFVEYMWAGWLLLVKSLLVFVGPVMLERLVLAAENNSSWNLIGCYIAILFISKLLGAIVAAHYNLSCQNLSVSVSGGIKGAMYQKILRLSSGSRQKYTIGNLTNLYTVDTDRVVRVSVALHNFWALPLQVGAHIACV
jgi:ABC-type multidrug transport system fused ATPase/permease subunit